MSGAEKDPHRNLARLLAHNKKAVRDNTVRKLGEWLARRKCISHMDLLKIWKGLFYCFWMSDKRSVQKELSENISKLIESMSNPRLCAYLQATFETLGREWGGIDALRMDKFMMLVRDILYQILMYLKKSNFELSVIKAVTNVFSTSLFLVESKVDNRGLCLHSTEIFIDELTKALKDPAFGGGDNVPSFKSFLQLLSPFFDYLRFGPDRSHFKFVREEVFDRLIEAVGKEHILGLIVDGAKLSSILLFLASDESTLEANRDDMYEMREHLLAKLAHSGEAEIESIEFPESYYVNNVKEEKIHTMKRKWRKAKKSPSSTPNGRKRSRKGSLTAKSESSEGSSESKKKKTPKKSGSKGRLESKKKTPPNKSGSKGKLESKKRKISENSVKRKPNRKKSLDGTPIRVSTSVGKKKFKNKKSKPLAASTKSNRPKAKDFF
ncbi:hypothetical protein AAMO2058_000889800 [Amorphochlora amoebiformis]